MSNSGQNQNKFGADEIINNPNAAIEVELTNKVPSTNTNNTNNTNTNTDTEKNKYLKFYELNEDGLRLYGQYKKEQHLRTLKWSVLGTTFGAGLGVLFEISFKKMNPRRKDYWKTLLLFSCITFCTYEGFNVSTNDFKKKQNELVEKYGKEVISDI